MEISPKFRGRSRAAFWSKSILAFAAVLSLLLLPFGFDLESMVIVAGLLTVTFFEFRVHRYFLLGDARGPGLGFRNQACFAAGILAYGLYHAAVPEPIPPEYQNMLDEPTLALIQSTIRDGYLAIGIIGGISQFALAWYYRGASRGQSMPTEE